MTDSGRSSPAGELDARLPVPASPYGPLNALSWELHLLTSSQRMHEALALADRYEAIARAFDDDRTVGFIMQCRMYAYAQLREHDEAIRVGVTLLAHHRASGSELAEAKTLADLGKYTAETDRMVECMGYLARAGLLLDNTTRRNDRYAAALVSYGLAATAAGLYEVAASAYTRLLEYHGEQTRMAGGYFYAQIYTDLLVTWGLRLDQLGHTTEATRLFRRVAEITGDWLAGDEDPDERREVAAERALACAKLGRFEEAIALAGPVVLTLRAQDRGWGAWYAHMALAVSLRAGGDLAGARTELLAARELSETGALTRERLTVQFELAELAAATLSEDSAAGADLREAVRAQTRQLWRQRLQRIAMLRQARQREELEIKRVQAEAALLYDPLTGLGNRRRFDQVIAAVDAGQLFDPVSLLIIDIDKFKAINDTHSHSAGDQVLRELGVILTGNCGSAGIPPIRYAGDEFTVFLNADLAAAVEVAERIRIAVSGADLDRITPGTHVTVSAGVATLRPGMTASALFRTADARLYQAKRDGRDRVVG
jgi:diguanylate cyclase (GGDEF)-like protein